jgi:splicing factor 3A subunit 1
MPNISAQDLEIVKLTAQYAAKNGRSWVTQLSQREGGNYQFDFLRPQHSLNMFFNRLVEQYKDLLEGETADGGRPQEKRIAELEHNIRDRFHVLERAKKRAEYLKYQEKQKVETEEKAEKDKIAFAQIDWHDFTVVATVVFDERDEHADMPAPKLLNDMLSLSLEEKANMRIGVDKRLEEAVPDFTDYEAIYGHAQPMPAAQMPAPQPYTPQPLVFHPTQLHDITDTSSSTPPQATPYVAPEAPSLQAERERARAATKASQQTTRIRSDYVPQAQLRNRTANTSICPNCKQAFPNEEMAEHLRIEMLDPQWREQSRKDQQRSSTTNLSMADVANNLKRLASQRSDVFDPVTGAALTEEEQSRRKRAELGSYDGTSSVPNQAALGAMGQLPGQQAPPGTDVQEQIRQLHEKYKK